MIDIFNNNIVNALVGYTSVKKICVGTNIVWEKPYDAEVEYLESKEGAYIDTGVRASGNLHIKVYLVDYFTESYYGSWAFGGRDAFNNKAFGIYINANTHKVEQAYYNNTTTRNLYSSYPQSCWVEMKSGSLKIGNTTHTFTGRTFTSSYNFYLFGLNNGGSFAGGKDKKLGAAYITNGVTTLNLIPVRKNGIGYYYDTISGNLIGNSSDVGFFNYGNDVN